MGKMRAKRRLHSMRPSPIGSYLIDENDTHFDDNLFTEIMSKLTDGKPKERMIGAQMITNYMSVNKVADGINVSSRTSKELNQMVKVLSSLCCDRAENVRSVSLDSLCQMSCLSDQMCEMMISQDVMTSIIALMNKFSQYKWSQDKKCANSVTIFVSACRLLTNLCCNSNKAVKIFNGSDLCQIMIHALKSFNDCIEISIASGQCLSVVVEENVVPELIKDENINLLKSLLTDYSNSPSVMHLANLAAYILTNLSIDLEADLMEMVFNVIFATLNVSCLEQLKELTNKINDFLDDGKKEEEVSQCYEQLSNVLYAKRVAFELLTNLTGFEDVNEDEMMECSDENNSSDDEMTEQIEVITDHDPIISPEIQNLILEKCIPSKAIEHLSEVNNEMKEILMKHSFGKDILNSIQMVQMSSLACIHNLVLSLPNDKIGINIEVWNQICAIVFSNCDSNLIEEATNTMRAMISINKDIILSDEELEKLCLLCNSSTASIAIKVNVIKIMGHLAERSTDLQFIEKVSCLLLEGLKNESNLVLKAEIFDAIIDIFSEDNKTDAVLKKLDLNKLKEFAKIFKKEANRTKSNEDPIISTVKLNLMRFIKYKQKILAKVP